jgi:hypothetical protein
MELFAHKSVGRLATPPLGGGFLEDAPMRKTITAIVATASITAAALVTPKPAEARCLGCWAGAGIAAAIIGGAIASQTYGYGYGYPAYGSGYGYPAGYGDGYPSNYGYGYPGYGYAYAPVYYGYAPRVYYGRRHYRD